MTTLHPCSRVVKSRGLRRIALPLAILVALFLPNLPAVPILSLGRVFASVPGPLRRPKSAQMMSEQHIVHIPYFIESDDMTSILTLNNNMNDMATATVTLFNMKGQSLTLPPIELAPQLPARFDLGQLAKNPDFSSGNVQISFNGLSMGITSQVSVISAAHRVAFESVEDEAMDFSSSRLDAILCLPNAETHGRIALTNTTAAPIAVTAAAHNGDQNHQRRITLDPHETELVEANEFLESGGDGPPRATVLTLQHNGSPGALMATGFAISEETGFSCNFPFVDPSTVVSAKLAGAHVRMGLPKPNGGFPSGTSFSAPLVLANVGGQQTQATVWVDYTIDSVPHRIQVGVASLAPGQVSQLELSQALASRGILPPLDDAGIDVAYTGPVGTVIGRLTSFDQTGDFAFEVPVKDPLAGMSRSGGYPWRLDGGYTTVVHLKNTINAEVRALVQVRYEGGNYNPDRIRLGPFQTVAIDIRGLRDAQQKDLRGGVMPPDVESGQIVWFEQTPGSLIGRAEVANVGGGVASSFGCGEFCGPGLSLSSLSPSSTTMAVGDSGVPFTPKESDMDCSGAPPYAPYPASNVSWSSTDTTVATVAQDGTVTAVGGGTASILATWTVTTWDCSLCQSSSTTTTAGGDIAVQVPTSLYVGSVTTLTTGNSGDYGCTTSQDWGIKVNVQYQVKDQNGQDIRTSALEPQE